MTDGEKKVTGKVKVKSAVNHLDVKVRLADLTCHIVEALKPLEEFEQTGYSTIAEDDSVKVTFEVESGKVNRFKNIVSGLDGVDFIET